MSTGGQLALHLSWAFFDVLVPQADDSVVGLLAHKPCV
jgi:hypothetical protein